MFTPSSTLWDTPRFCLLKDFINICIYGNFHQYANYGCQIKKLQSFLYWFSIHEMTPFWDFWPLTHPNIVWTSWNSGQRYTKIRKTQCLKSPSKCWILAQMECCWWKLYSFGSYWCPIYRWKTKILLNTKISAKTTSLWIINKVSPRSNKIHRILVKSSQKTFSGSKMDLNYHQVSKNQHKVWHSP